MAQCCAAVILEKAAFNLYLTSCTQAIRMQVSTVTNQRCRVFFVALLTQDNKAVYSVEFMKEFTAAFLCSYYFLPQIGVEQLFVIVCEGLFNFPSSAAAAAVSMCALCGGKHPSSAVLVLAHVKRAVSGLKEV